MQDTYRKAIRLEIESYGVVNFSVGQSSAWMTELNTFFSPPNDQYAIKTISRFLDNIQITPLENLATHEETCNAVEKEFEAFRKGIRVMVEMDNIHWDKVISTGSTIVWESETRTTKDFPDDDTGTNNNEYKMRVTIHFVQRYTVQYKALPPLGNSI